MKVKLLKKARKRFKILYYYNQHTVDLMDAYKNFPEYPLKYEKVDHTDNLEYDKKSFNQAVNNLKSCIVSTLKEQYKFLGRKRQAKNAYENKFKQIWP